MSKKIKLGIVGTGGMANYHADQFSKMTGVELTACHDVLPDRAAEFAKKHSFQHVAGNLTELLDRVDAVDIVTPDRFHAAPSLAALQAGKHLLCEKPLTVTLAEARQVAAAARQAAGKGVIHLINFSYRKSAAFQKSMELVATGQLGTLRHIHSYYLPAWLAATVWGGWEKESMLWRLQTAAGSGGVLGDLGCHILDLTTGVAGSVARIRCDLRTFPKIDTAGNFVTEWQGKQLDANDTAVIEIEFTNGAIGLVHTTRWGTGHSNSLRLEAHGTEGGLMFDLDKGYDELNLCLGAARHKSEWTTETIPATPSNYERFIRAIQTGQPDQPDIIRGAQIQAYLDACLRSAKSGQWEAVQPWE